MNAFIRIFGCCLSLLIFTLNTSLSQNNLILKLTESSVLLDKLHVCGDSDFQQVVIGIAGDDKSVRSNIVASLTLFEGVTLVNLDIAASTQGVTLLNSSTPALPQFSIPDMDAVNLAEVIIAFSVQADCGVVNAINSNNELQLFDTWTLNYEIESVPFSEIYKGVEYKNTIVIPNLSLSVENTEVPVKLGTPFQRSVRIINSGLNSYLNEFIYQVSPASGIVYQSLNINGIPLPFSRAINTNGDSVYLATIGQRFFSGNTSSGSPANGDDLFDVDEVVTIVEQLLLTDCGANGSFNLNTKHETSWGCNDVACQVESTTATISLGIGEEQIQFKVGQDAALASYCTPGATSIIISNNGFEFDEGSGAILDISAGIGFGRGEGFLLSENGYQITTTQISQRVR